MSQQKISDASRGYGCPCGKTYLSYPALFTHVKQKHQGEPPGKLIKPTTGKIRGRPKTRVNTQISKNSEDTQLSQIIARIEHDIPQLIEDQFINYSKKFERSQGTRTCQDVASTFLQHFKRINDNGMTILVCFFNELKSAVNDKFGVEYWKKEKPDEIIQMANQLYLQHEQKQKIFPIHKELFKELLYNYFQWLYAKKHTDHRLVKNNLSEQKIKINS